MLKLPVIKGNIERRILANYRIDPAVMQAVLPAPFRAIVVNGYGLGGICLIRLSGIRPKFFPVPWGIGSENAAHRFAVEWESKGKSYRGVYIPRRDSSSLLNHLVGGRVFPGVHHRAKFEVTETETDLSVALHSDDDKVSVKVVGEVVSEIPKTSVFDSINQASEFFQLGSLGYSDTKTNGRFDGIELCCQQWQVKGLEVTQIESSYFDDQVRFPNGSIEFDCALLMRNINHEWHSREDLCC